MISITVKTAARISPPVAIKDCITYGVIQGAAATVLLMIPRLVAA